MAGNPEVEEALERLRSVEADLERRYQRLESEAATLENRILFQTLAQEKKLQQTRVAKLARLLLLEERTEPARAARMGVAPACLLGAEAPEFEAEALVGDEHTSVRYANGVLTVGAQPIAGEYLVLFFFPLAFTYVCPTELHAFQARRKEFERLRARVVGVSVDSIHALRAWKGMPVDQGGPGPVDFPLVSDLLRTLSRNFGVLLPSGMAARGTFIMDEQGIIQASTACSLGVGRSVDEILRLVEALRMAAQTGKVCPAGWRPGEALFDPTPAGVGGYLARLFSRKQG